jgi:hypothetical protein
LPQLVLSTGNGVNGFTLDPSLGEFILTHPNIKVCDNSTTTTESFLLLLPELQEEIVTMSCISFYCSDSE